MKYWNKLRAWNKARKIRKYERLQLKWGIKRMKAKQRGVEARVKLEQLRGQR